MIEMYNIFYWCILYYEVSSHCLVVSEQSSHHVSIMYRQQTRSVYSRMYTTSVLPVILPYLYNYFLFIIYFEIQTCFRPLFFYSFVESFHLTSSSLGAVKSKNGKR